MSPRRLSWIAAIAAGAACVAPAADARQLRAGPGAAVLTLEAAAAGDTVTLEPGVHAGPLRLTRPMCLRGEPGAVVDGGHHGSVVEIGASGTVVEDLAIRGSGTRVLTTDSGIRVVGGGSVTLRRLVLRDVLYGIYAERAPSLTVEGCRLSGRVAPLDETGEGNGVHLWYSGDARLTRNSVDGFVDAIYLSFADGARIAGNRLRNNGRYGLHTMYCQGSILAANEFTHNAAGCAIMFSNHLRVERNTFVHNRGPRTYGILLRDCSDGDFLANRLVDNTVAVFMDNSNRNRIRGNLLQDNGWGLLIFSSCAGNEVADNDFLNDDYPVALDMRRTDNRFDDGRHGNYWSESAPYDLDGDGVSDVPYSPVGAFAFLSKQYPDLSVLAKSPAVAALTVAERVFPALRPSEVVDRYPRIAPAGSSRVLEPGADDRRPDAAAAAGFALLLAGGIAGLGWRLKP
jgi:nitrous oxidase accessory protein